MKAQRKNSSSKTKRWSLKYKKKPKDLKQIVDILLKNRGITSANGKKEFLNPTSPEKLSLNEVKLDAKKVAKAVKRVEKAIKGKEGVVVYGDYDADGICATAILWEALYKKGRDVLPYIPERFSEGYGLNPETIKKLKKENENLSLIVTVDNGITAKGAVKEANKLGIDVIVTDHHQKEKSLPSAFAVVHTTEIGGAGVSYIFAREVKKKLGEKVKRSALELVAIGTLADQIPLLGPNRSFVKHGLDALNETQRPGLLSLFKEAQLEKGTIGTYQAGFVIAPRLNAMGRLEHAIDSLRLLCTTNVKNASLLAKKLARTNLKRQKIVDDVLVLAKDKADKKDWDGVLVIAHESFHEGVIGLAASKLVEEFYRPAIVVSMGKEVSKASGRSIPGFNIIEAIRKLDDLLISGGGHPMAAGFSIETKNLGKFEKKLSKIATSLLTSEILEKTLKIDMEIEFNQINFDLTNELRKFEPTGLGNPTASFKTDNVVVLEARSVGRDNTHLKLKLEKEGITFSGIAFNLGFLIQTLGIKENSKIDICFNVDENLWNGRRDVELKVKDLRKTK